MKPAWKRSWKYLVLGCLGLMVVTYLALERPSGSSILNILPVRVVGLEPEQASRVTVVLQAGREKVLARITRKSTEALGLAIGREVFAQVKSVAVLV